MSVFLVNLLFERKKKHKSLKKKIYTLTEAENCEEQDTTTTTQKQSPKGAAKSSKNTTNGENSGSGSGAVINEVGSEDGKIGRLSTGAFEILAGLRSRVYDFGLASCNGFTQCPQLLKKH